MCAEGQSSDPKDQMTELIVPAARSRRVSNVHSRVPLTGYGHVRVHSRKLSHRLAGWCDRLLAMWPNLLSPLPPLLLAPYHPHTHSVPVALASVRERLSAT